MQLFSFNKAYLANVPVRPGGQMQLMAPSTVAMHCPPLAQGLSKHMFDLIWQFRPLKPTGQEQ